MASQTAGNYIERSQTVNGCRKRSRTAWQQPPEEDDDDGCDLLDLLYPGGKPPALARRKTNRQDLFPKKGKADYEPEFDVFTPQYMFYPAANLCGDEVSEEPELIIAMEPVSHPQLSLTSSSSSSAQPPQEPSETLSATPKLHPPRPQSESAKPQPEQPEQRPRQPPPQPRLQEAKRESGPHLPPAEPAITLTQTQLDIRDAVLNGLRQRTQKLIAVHISPGGSKSSCSRMILKEALDSKLLSSQRECLYEAFNRHNILDPRIGALAECKTSSTIRSCIGHRLPVHPSLLSFPVEVGYGACPSLVHLLDKSPYEIPKKLHIIDEMHNLTEQDFLILGKLMKIWPNCVFLMLVDLRQPIYETSAVDALLFLQHIGADWIHQNVSFRVLPSVGRLTTSLQQFMDPRIGDFLREHECAVEGWADPKHDPREDLPAKNCRFLLPGSVIFMPDTSNVAELIRHCPAIASDHIRLVGFSNKEKEYWERKIKPQWRTSGVDYTTIHKSQGEETKPGGSLILVVNVLSNAFLQNVKFWNLLFVALSRPKRGWIYIIFYGTMIPRWRKQLDEIARLKKRGEYQEPEPQPASNKLTQAQLERKERKEAKDLEQQLKYGVNSAQQQSFQDWLLIMSAFSRIPIDEIRLQWRESLIKKKPFSCQLHDKPNWGLLKTAWETGSTAYLKPHVEPTRLSLTESSSSSSSTTSCPAASATVSPNPPEQPEATASQQQRDTDHLEDWVNRHVLYASRHFQNLLDQVARAPLRTWGFSFASQRETQAWNQSLMRAPLYGLAQYALQVYLVCAIATKQAVKGTELHLRFDNLSRAAKDWFSVYHHKKMTGEDSIDISGNQHDAEDAAEDQANEVEELEMMEDPLSDFAPMFAPRDPIAQRQQPHHRIAPVKRKKAAISLQQTKQEAYYEKMSGSILKSSWKVIRGPLPHPASHAARDIALTLGTRRYLENMKNLAFDPPSLDWIEGYLVMHQKKWAEWSMKVATYLSRRQAPPPQPELPATADPRPSEEVTLAVPPTAGKSLIQLAENEIITIGVSGMKQINSCPESISLGKDVLLQMKMQHPADWDEENDCQYIEKLDYADLAKMQLADAIIPENRATRTTAIIVASGVIGSWPIRKARQNCWQWREMLSTSKRDCFSCQEEVCKWTEWNALWQDLTPLPLDVLRLVYDYFVEPPPPPLLPIEVAVGIGGSNGEDQKDDSKQGGEGQSLQEPSSTHREAEQTVTLHSGSVLHSAVALSQWCPAISQ